MCIWYPFRFILIQQFVSSALHWDHNSLFIQFTKGCRFVGSLTHKLDVGTVQSFSICPVRSTTCLILHSDKKVHHLFRITAWPPPLPLPVCLSLLSLHPLPASLLMSLLLSVMVWVIWVPPVFITRMFPRLLPGPLDSPPNIICRVLRVTFGVIVAVWRSTQLWLFLSVGKKFKPRKQTIIDWFHFIQGVITWQSNPLFA